MIACLKTELEKKKEEKEHRCLQPEGKQEIAKKKDGHFFVPPFTSVLGARPRTGC